MGVPRNFDHAIVLVFLHPHITIKWHYNEAHHGKSQKDGMSGKVNNLVYPKNFSGDVVINTPGEFVKFPSQMSSADCLFPENSEFIQEPEEVLKAPPIS